MKNILIFVLMAYFQHSVEAECFIKEVGENLPMVICRDVLFKKGHAYKVTGDGKAPLTLLLYNATGDVDKTSIKLIPHKRLIIVNSELNSISCDSIEKLEILNIDSSKLASVDSKFWTCAKKLQSVHIVDSQFKEPFSTAFLKNQPELRVLAVKKSKMPTQLTKDSFQNLNKLEELYLEKVGLEKIDSDSFVNLPNLQNLTLRNNVIAEEPKDKVILGLEKLKNLDVTKGVFGIYVALDHFIRRIPESILKQAKIHLCQSLKDGLKCIAGEA